MVLHSMEPTFYDDQHLINFGLKSEDGVVMGEHVTQLKKSMTLDLKGQQRAGRMAFAQAPVLSSPDLNMLKLGSPELEKLIIAQQNGLVTTTPTPTTQILFPRTVTEEQERYARGFVDALNELHHSDSSQMSGAQQRMDAVDSDSEESSNDGSSPSSSPASSVTYTNLEPQGTSGYHHHHGLSGGGHSAVYAPSVVVKDEPQTVPASVGGGGLSSASSSPAQLSTSVSPIDMECQERIKLERKRQRNRIAASKCRRRKLERIARLEDKVRLLKGENSELSGVVNRLKEQVCALKEQVMDHVHSGCQIMVSSHF